MSRSSSAGSARLSIGHTGKSPAELPALSLISSHKAKLGSFDSSRALILES